MKSKYLHLNNLSQSFEGDSVSTPCTAATNADRYSFFEKWNDLKSVKLQPKKTDSQKYGPREKRLYNYLNGEKYDGEWTGHVRSGFGTMNWNDRFIYQGQWRTDMQHGPGKLLVPNGSKYEGHFEQGVLEGLGVVTNKSGETYHGEWRSGKKNGYGISQYSASSWDPDAGTYYYIGEHKDNKREGFGFEILILKNDSISRKLVTNWSDNKPNGLGIKWVNGAFEGKYQVIYRCGRQVSEVPIDDASLFTPDKQVGKESNGLTEARLDRHAKLSESLERLTMPEEFDDKVEEIKTHFNLTTDFDKLIRFEN